MAESEVTTEQLSSATGISRTAIGRKLAGTQAFTIPELTRISTFLEVPFAALLAEHTA